MVSFFYASFKKFLAAKKNPEALYFIADYQRLYRGDKLIASTSVKFVNDLPQSQDALTDVLYVHLSPIPNNTEFMYWDGEKWTRAGGAISNVTASGCISVEISEDKVASFKLLIDNSGNVQLTETEKGLKAEVDIPVYSMIKLKDPTEGYSSSFSLTKDGVNVGSVINIPKDMVVSSGEVVTNPEGYPEGTYIVLTLANAKKDKLYINVSNLIEYVTSGSDPSDTVVIAVDEMTHKVTATVTDASIEKSKLSVEVQTSLGKADSAVQKIITGTANGTVSVDGSDVSVKGLTKSAFTPTAVNGVSDNNGDLVTAAQVKTAIDSSVSGALTWSSF